jgi:hypothetical protein
MNRAILCLSLAGLILASCKKNNEVALPTGGEDAAGAQGAAGQPKSAFVPPVAGPANSPAAMAQSELEKKLASGNPQLQLQVLDDLLQAWNMSQSTPPKELEDFVKAKMLIRLPQPPPGKRFAIDQKLGRVVLISQ